MSLLPSSPIITSLLQVDWYKLTTQQVAFGFPDVRVKFSYHQRSKVRVPDIVPIEAVRDEIDHVRTLSLTDNEWGWLFERQLEGTSVFAEDYLDTLRTLKLPEADVGLTQDGGAFTVDSTASWFEVTLWETIWLNIINTLYYRYLLKERGVSLANAWAEGDRRLDEKIAILKANPDLQFVEFGNRRAFSPEWQAHVDERFVNELGDQCVGISNVALARRFGKNPAGTYPHEGPMVFQGIFHDVDDRMGRMYSQELWFDHWYGMYGAPLSVALTDTYTTEYHLRWFGDKRFRLWRAQRLDSGNLEKDGELLVRQMHDFDIDTRQKLLVPSDGLELPTMLRFRDRFAGRIKQLPGWGTDATNDLGFTPVSHVAKAIEACGHSLVKLSNNPEKATGTPEAIERVKRLTQYSPEGHVAVECKY